LSIVIATDHAAVCGLTEHAAERHDGRDTGEVEEEDSREALQVEAVRDVAAVVAISTSNVQQQTTEQSAITPANPTAD